MENLKFEELGLSDWIIRAVKDMGFEEASPIQSQAIPLIKEGHDIIGQSQTGTGKTASFGIPCLEMIDSDDRKLQALILCPTRELAIQVSEEFRNGNILTYKKENGSWYFDRWETVWSRSGSADGFVWPYIR